MNNKLIEKLQREIRVYRNIIKDIEGSENLSDLDVMLDVQFFKGKIKALRDVVEQLEEILD